MIRFIRRQPPGRIIAVGFALVILLASGLLMLPCSVRSGVSLRYTDALYTAVSAVCVTGLTTVDVANTFTPFGQTLLGIFIQIGGLGVAAVGAGIILMLGARVNLQGNTLIRESMNLNSAKGVTRFLRSIFLTTLAFEFVGAVLSFIAFLRDQPPLKAIGLGLFHSVAAFNNSGFDILGNFENLAPYRDSVLLNLTTMALTVFGGIGFLVIREVWNKRFRWRRFSLHTRVVLTVTAVLILGGALLIRLTEDVSWMDAFFLSISARTAGFSTFSLNTVTNAGLAVVSVLMFIGASPGSTGGGIKTTTAFVLMRGLIGTASGREPKAFRYTLPGETFRKAAVIALLGITVVVTGTYGLILLEPELPLRDLLFEAFSAFGTAGLSTGISPTLCTGAKLLSMLMMYIGRLGPLTVASLWSHRRQERVRYPEGQIAVG